MDFKIDHDLHIHTRLSLCSKDENQTPDALISYALANDFNTICVTDHFWDNKIVCNTAVNWWYEKQNFEHISQSLPLPYNENVRFLFGCEADMDSDNVIGIHPSRYDDFDFIVVSTTHFHHMAGKEWQDNSNEAIACRWLKRMEAVFKSTLPFYKLGIAHPACELMNKKSRKDYLSTLDLITDAQYEGVFSAAAELGVGIELNVCDFMFPENEEASVLRMFAIAKSCGCKFYFGSDAHFTSQLQNSVYYFSKAANLLCLKESDKFII